ncbi:hypothetical protein HRJ45_12400 [Vibrio coralliilyticus]|uniref:hypothetical protein n=1 Tax=Vibrio coralliilyticus TaxID=190893 RepID=UPI001560C4CC|nr:hypothetical protein [Vibrio coralliilyticus]NRF25901.1 hypothetical protein [Vibrio coralliilyticus]NRF79910.1 hypothetical protein [Vibrio coralliilyticus]
MIREVSVALISSLLTAVLLWAVGWIGKIPSVISVPSGAVVAFNLESCPPDGGWREYKAAYGRFIRGIDRSKDYIDPAGERTIGSFQEDAIKSHSHTTTIMIGDNNIDGVDSTTRRSGDHHNQNRSTGRFGVDETRPKNVALLYCEKV